MSSLDINQHIRYRIYIWATVTTLLLSISAFVTGHTQSGLTSLIFSALLMINSINIKKAVSQMSSQSVDLPSTDEMSQIFYTKEAITHLIILLLAAITIYSLAGHTHLAEPWIYIFPLLIYFIYPIKWANYALFAYSLTLIFLLNYYYPTLDKIQLMLNYLLCVSLTLAFVVLREVRNRQIKPLRRTDNLTSASTREYLRDDLQKEILRSEREGTELTVLALAVDPGCLDKVETIDRDLLLSKLGHCLHQILRPFDGYYRLEQDQFLVVLPHTHTKEGIRIAEKIRLSAKESLSKSSLKVTLSIGVAGLNVGDDAESMSSKALEALSQAQARGKNSTRSYVDHREASA